METSSKLKQLQSNRFIFLGFALFLLGLVVGLIVPLLANPRMGVSSHLEGVMNGMFLIILGLIWNRLTLSIKWLKISFWLAIYGTFINWLGILIAAIFDSGEMLSVAANGKKGAPIPEAIVTFSLITLSIAMLVVCIIVLIGLRKEMFQKN